MATISETRARRDRLRLLSEQQGHRCCYCGIRFKDDSGPPADVRLYFDPRPSIEHVIRLAEGGAREWHNEVAACRGCNSARGEMSAEAFFELVAAADLEAMRRTLRTAAESKKRRRKSDRRTGRAYRVICQKGKWPPILGEVALTPERQRYFDLVYGPWRKQEAA